MTGSTTRGLLYDELDAPTVAHRFRDEQVDALFSPHCNFGTESAIGALARELRVPVLLWGPRDDAPAENGMRLPRYAMRPLCHEQGAAAAERALHLYRQLPGGEARVRARV